MDQWLSSTVKFSSGHIKIVHDKYIKKERLLPLQFSVNDQEKIIKKVESIDRVELAIPRIKFGAQLEFNGKTADCLGLGIDPMKEAKNTTIEDHVIKGTYWENQSDEIGQGILIGVQTAEELGVDAAVVGHAFHEVLSAPAGLVE